MPWPSQSPDLNTIEDLWEILEQHLRQRFPAPSTKHQIMEFLVEEWCRIPPIEFQRLVESKPRPIKAVLEARGGPTSY
jgi:transposase